MKNVIKYAVQMSRTDTKHASMSFPRRTFAVKKEHSFDKPLGYVGKSPGHFFEQMVKQSLRQAIKDGAENNQTLDKALPFLRNTQLENVQCVPLAERVFHPATKITKKNAQKRWIQVLSSVPSHTIVLFDKTSHSPESLIAIPKGSDGRVLLCLQAKNEVLSVKQLWEEIEKTSNLSVNKDDEIVLVVVARDVQRQLHISQKTWHSGEVLSARKTSKNLVIPERMSAVLVTGEKLIGLLDVFADFLCRTNQENVLYTPLDCI